MKIILGKKLFDYYETAQILGVSRLSVARYVKLNELNPVTLTRRKYLSEDDIRKIITPKQKVKS